MKNDGCEKSEAAKYRNWRSGRHRKTLKAESGERKIMAKYQYQSISNDNENQWHINNQGYQLSNINENICQWLLSMAQL
jgi:hypothetical protein